MSYIPKGANKAQVALLALMIPGDLCAYYNIGGDDLKKALMLIRQYCEMPALGSSWRKQVQFAPPTGAPGNFGGAPSPGFNFGNFSYAAMPPYGLGSYSLPNEATLRQAVITLLTAVFLSPEGPFTMSKPLPIRRHFAEMMGGNLNDFVECLRVVEKDFNLPAAPYDVRPR